MEYLMAKIIFMASVLFWLLGVESCLAADFILDPGHSPSKPGTYSCSGGQEYAYNNELVETIINYLKQKNISVDVTRKKNGEISLLERAAKAKGKKLFLSIHHDSAQSKYIKMINGHPCTDKVSGFSIFVSGKNPYFKESFWYARVLGKMLIDQGFTASTHHGEPIKGENRKLIDPATGVYQYDDLVVLKNSHAPAVLLEAGVIINPKDDELCKSLDYRLKIAYAVGEMFRFVGEATKNY